MIEIRNI